MRRFSLALSVIALGSTACMTPDEGSIDQNLQRLDDLQVFEVGLLLDNAPQGSQNCYGPCDEADERAIENARAEQAARLGDGGHQAVGRQIARHRGQGCLGRSCCAQVA